MSSDAAELFSAPGFVRELGIRPGPIGHGRAQLDLEIRAMHLQHHGFVHAGVAATLADQAAGAAATSRLAPGQAVLTVEFKINLLKPLVGKAIQAQAEVLRAGRQIHVVESRIHVTEPENPEPVVVALVTLCVVDLPGSRP